MGIVSENPSDAVKLGKRILRTGGNQCKKEMSGLQRQSNAKEKEKTEELLIS